MPEPIAAEVVERRKQHLLRLLTLIDYAGAPTPRQRGQAVAELTDYCANVGEDTHEDGEAVAAAAGHLLGVPFGKCCVACEGNLPCDVHDDDDVDQPVCSTCGNVSTECRCDEKEWDVVNDATNRARLAEQSADSDGQREGATT